MKTSNILDARQQGIIEAEMQNNPDISGFSKNINELHSIFMDLRKSGEDFEEEDINSANEARTEIARELKEFIDRAKNI